MSWGGVAHRAVCRTLGIPAGNFQHNGTVPLGSRHALVSSFHPSRLNVNTGRLTPVMFDQVLQNVRSLVGDDVMASPS